MQLKELEKARHTKRERRKRQEMPLVAIVGSADPELITQLEGQIEVMVLSEMYGLDLAMSQPKHCIAWATAEMLQKLI